MKRKWIFLFLCVIFVTVFWINAFALKNFLYWELPWLDIPMHFLGGFWLGLSALWLYYLSGFYKKISDEHRKKGYVWLLALTSALVLGSVWEIYEFGMDIIADKTDRYDALDTLSDLFFDAVGGTLATFMFITGNSHKKE
ncbi:MAG: hypothetical protein KAR24_01215 [Candidatus Pacebacteria bacterium]|nr:hypothetical protein [Candidatus Paceibacterota bacterium]